MTPNPPPRPVSPSLGDPLPHCAQPLAQYLPAIMQADDLTGRWMAGLDDLLAPILMILDAIDFYADPWLAPPDLLDWLGEWVGAEIPPDLPVESRRRLIATSADLHGRRGTLSALREVLDTTTEAVIHDVDDGGSTTWSTAPRAPITPRLQRDLVVTVSADRVEAQRVADVVAAWCPANVPHRVEIIEP